MKQVVGIVAYGSLIDDPGPEIEGVIDWWRPQQTPFKVEFARRSRKRGYAPTLIPVEEGGTSVLGRLFVLRPIALPLAKDMLWRRETGRSSSYCPPANPPGENDVVISEYPNLEDVDIAIATQISKNIRPLDADMLARYAIESALDPEINEEENGIAYLYRVKKHGIETPLMMSYERSILRRLSASSLSEALDIVKRCNHSRGD